MLNLHRFEQLSSRFTIRDRDTNHRRPLRFNPSQQKIMRKCIEWQDRGNNLWIIFLKARRLGISTWATALLVSHCLARGEAEALTVAQLKETANDLFMQAHGFSKCLPYKLPTPTKSELYFPHKDGLSRLRKATAKTVIGGRGLTFSAIHMTEAAFYPGEESFVALLNTISGKNPDNIVIIETTANGMEGPGEAYYNYWQAAVRGDNGFLPIFLPWYDDPGCVLDPAIAADAPADDYEKMLMKEYHCTRAQIAWFRWCLETKCGGSIYKWRQEYPSTPDEAFVSTGNPAFDLEEMSIARKSQQKPIAEGDIELGDADEPIFVERRGGDLKIYEFPESGRHYFNGVDAAKGVEVGDFACCVGWNGCTGDMAFRYASRVGPELMGEKAYALGMLYNKAMINVEFTGGWGYLIAKELRDKWHYPAQYMWKSRDESPDSKPRRALGWETTDRSRRMMLDVYRKALRRGEVHPKDQAFIAQMSRAVTDLGFRWTIIHGHDDIFMAAMLGWIAKEQYHISHSDDPQSRHANNLDGSTEGLMPEGSTQSGLPKYQTDLYSNELGMMLANGNEHIRKLQLAIQRSKQPNRLIGI